ncbi:hypothetical protein HPB47_020223 [Ixodes persulcatus]|uniref:Uncharacterized protein n=1 Tax=Ixodes persulcatus TaxID=34615 RepID=A0AC60QFY1_IXOPE|nr:hypothetical protein HPB47_020223 [Ixodes persulcatus]
MCRLVPSPRGCRIELGDVTPHNINQLKRLNQVVFPVSYNDKFYKDVLEAGELAKLGTCSRPAKSRQGRGSVPRPVGQLLTRRPLSTARPRRHVQVNNESAIEFYTKFGFKIVETKEHYYKRIEPADAHVLQKTLRPTKTSLQNGVASDKERS